MSSVINTATATGPGFSAQSTAIRDVFSAEIFFTALPILKFDQFTTKKTELGVQTGRTIQMPKYNSIRRGGRLTEGVKMKTQSMSLANTPLTVYEYGNAVGFSEALLKASFLDQLAAASMLLGRDLAVVLDLDTRDVAVSGANVLYAANRNSRPELAVGDDFDTQLVKDGVETLETNNVPKFMGDHYICFLHPHQGRGLRDDQDWINASLYAGATAIYTGEIGRYEDVRFVTTTVMPNGANSAVDPNTGDYVDIGYDPDLDGVGVDGANVYQAVMFGQYSIGHAVSLPVELRDNGVDDFGREHGLAWYAIFGNGELEANNLVVLESA